MTGMVWHVVGMPRLFASACTGQNRGSVACYQARADVPTCRRADVPTCRRADVLQLQREPHPALYIECGAAFFLANHANPCCTLSRFAIDNYHALRSCGAGFGGDAPWNFSLNPV